MQFMLNAVLLLSLLSLTISQQRCNPSCVSLNALEVWRREEGWWVGNYTFFGADGKPFRSEPFPYDYSSYRGFIHLELKGACLNQRNIFVYPPQVRDRCKSPNNTLGNGVCAINGNEKVFAADQSASDCDGNLAGPFRVGDFTFDTRTTVTLGLDDTILYQVRFPPEAGGALFQNQLTTVGPDGTRVRSAQGIFPGTGIGTYLSFFRERRVTEEVWHDMLAETRDKFNVLKEDYCGWDSEDKRTTASCHQHFTTPPCDVKPRNRTRCERTLKRYRSEGLMRPCNCTKTCAKNGSNKG